MNSKNPPACGGFRGLSKTSRRTAIKIADGDTRGGRDFFGAQAEKK